MFDFDDAIFLHLPQQMKWLTRKALLVGTYEPELDPLPAVTTITINDNPGVIYTGFQHDIRPYLAISQVLSFPSYREGFPNVLMQAGHYQHSQIGYNYRMSNVAAAIGCGQMEVLTHRILKRRSNFEYYKNFFAAAKEVQLLEEPDEDFYSNHWLTTLTIDGDVLTCEDRA